jgi:hypothetical protein
MTRIWLIDSFGPAQDPIRCTYTLYTPVLLLMSACKLGVSSQFVGHRLIVAQARVNVCKHVFRNKVDGLTALKYRGELRQ